MSGDEKNILRQRMRERRKAQGTGDAAALSLAAQEHILALPQWHEAHRVLLYARHGDETDTALLIQKALEQGKDVFLPRCRPPDRVDEHLMDAAAIRCLEDLCPGRYGIPEPDPATCPPIGLEEDTRPDLIVVPALALDRRGFRLGQGGGYYDRFLARFDPDPPLTLGLVYGFQVLERLPSKDWDRPVRAVCTEEGCAWTPW